MQLAKSSRTLLPLALSAVLATCAFAQDHPNVQPNAVRDQLTKQVSAGAQPQGAPQAAAKTPAPPAAKAPAPAKAQAPAKSPAPAAVKAPAKAPAAPAAAKPSASADAKDAKKTTSANATKLPDAAKPAEEKPVVKRDPFDALLTKPSTANASPENLPPGKAGLIVDTLRIDGIVRSSGGMIAIVSNPQQRVYFLKEGDKLYDGSVQKITLSNISFQEIGKDAFGKPLERTVAKNLYPSSGEKQ
jgi:Tfp pilus assembly protein PilP